MEIKEAIELLKTVRGNEYVATTDYENALNTVLAELDRQKQVKAEMRKVAWEEGYNQGYLTGAMESI